MFCSGFGEGRTHKQQFLVPKICLLQLAEDLCLRSPNRTALYRPKVPFLGSGASTALLDLLESRPYLNRSGCLDVLNNLNEEYVERPISIEFLMQEIMILQRFRCSNICFNKWVSIWSRKPWHAYGVQTGTKKRWRGFSTTKPMNLFGLLI